VEDGVELLVEGFAHGHTVGGQGDQTGSSGERAVNTGPAGRAEANSG
jgi:hypothetical protein